MDLNNKARSQTEATNDEQMVLPIHFSYSKKENTPL
jgi:hypothetical protein